jgi:integrase
MATNRLTDKEIRNLKCVAGKACHTVSDGGGLKVIVRPSGLVTFHYTYTSPRFKARKTVKLGTYPHMSLAQARLTVAQIKVKATQGECEFHDRNLNRNSDNQLSTLRYIADEWLDVHKTKVSDKQAVVIRRCFENHIFPKLGDLYLEELTAPIAIENFRSLANQGKLETLRRAIQWLNMVMRYAINTGRLDHNRIAGIRDAFPAPNETPFATLLPSQLPELMQTVSRSKTLPSTRNLILFQLHTMVRPSEAATAKWVDIDLEKAEWHIPAEVMKMKRDHVVPLSYQVIALLAEQKELHPHREYVFPGTRSPRSHANPQTANMALKRMGFKGRLVAHGMRALASTTLNEEGFNPDWIEASLAHIDDNSVRRAYNRALYLDDRRSMHDWWSNRIEEAAHV